jgi:hypothetical protein
MSSHREQCEHQTQAAQQWLEEKKKKRRAGHIGSSPRDESHGAIIDELTMIDHVKPFGVGTSMGSLEMSAGS